LKGKERKGKERKGKERKGKRKKINTPLSPAEKKKLHMFKNCARWFEIEDKKKKTIILLLRMILALNMEVEDKSKKFFLIEFDALILSLLKPIQDHSKAIVNFSYFN